MSECNREASIMRRPWPTGGVVAPCKKKGIILHLFLIITCNCVNVTLDCSGSSARTNLTLRRLMSYIYGAPILDVSRSHTTTQHSR